MKVNIGEQKEFRLASCAENCSGCCHLSLMSAGALLLRTGRQPVIVHRTAPVMVLFSCTSVVYKYIYTTYVDEIGMCRGHMLMYEQKLIAMHGKCQEGSLHRH